MTWHSQLRESGFIFENKALFHREKKVAEIVVLMQKVKSILFDVILNCGII